MKCLDCDKSLIPISGAHAPQVEIDMCQEGHGAWFDIGEEEAFFNDGKNPLKFKEILKNGIELEKEGSYPEHYRGKGCQRCWRILNWVKVSKAVEHRQLIVGLCYLHGIWVPENLLVRFPIGEEDLKVALKQNRNKKISNWFTYLMSKWGK